ncbi:hypothetical protein SAMIE_1023380 [Sphingobium amiense]|uniref:Uncharacterized protein n=1 Tax=Sphingobium amiense TaxID=135719 RepID=A0A494W8E8_9SPHN|nr:hypothetical protein [Sphingobium amiense]BBD98837.1 hypothetical protein SAMIE_1023380 [Sphingobium amiense]
MQAFLIDPRSYFLKFSLYLFTFVLFSMLLLFLCAAVVFRLDEIDGHSVSDISRIGFDTRDTGKSRMLSEMIYAQVKDSQALSTPPSSAIQEEFSMVTTAPVGRIVSYYPDYRRIFKGQTISTLWDLLPYLSFQDREVAIYRSLSDYRSERKWAFEIYAESGDGEVSSEARVNLVAYLWYCRTIVMPKLRRLLASRQIHPAERLINTTLDTLRLFRVDDDQVDRWTTKWMSVLYFIGVLFGRPDEVMANPIAAQESLDKLIEAMDAEASHVTLPHMAGPPFFKALVELSISTRGEDTDMHLEPSASGAFISALQSRNQLESDLINLLVIRGAFWRAWGLCVPKPIGDQGRCTSARSAFNATYGRSRPLIKSEGFGRTVDWLKSRSNEW